MKNFWETPFAKRYFEITRGTAVTYNGKTYRVGDIVKIGRGLTHFVITKMEYTKIPQSEITPTNFRPPLTITCQKKNKRTEFTTCSPEQLGELVFACEANDCIFRRGPNEVVFALNLFIDAFLSRDSLEYSSEGVSFSIGNLPLEIATSLENIKTFLLAPGGTDLHEALILFRRDMKDLDKGVEMFDVLSGRNTMVRAYIALENGDSKQNRENCRNTSGTALLGSMHTWITSKDRFRCDPTVAEYPEIKSSQQIDQVIEQIREALEEKKHTKHAIKEAQKQYSTKAVPNQFKGLRTNEPQQCISDVEHLLFYGIGFSVMAQLVEGLGPLQKSMLSTIQQTFHFPDRVTGIAFDFSKKCRSANSMSLYRKMIMYCVIFFSNILPDNLYKFFCDFAHLSWDLNRNGNTKESIEEVNHFFLSFFL